MTNQEKTAMVTDAEISARVTAMARELDCFTTRDVTLLTGTGRETLVKLRNAGKGPPSVLVGSTLLYPVQAFKGWINANIGNPHPKSRKRALTGDAP